jgi:hypothetical protein
MLRRSLFGPLALLLAASAVAACGQGDGNAAASLPTTALTDESTATPATAAPEAPAPTTPGVHLLDAGAEPRRELQLDLAAGSTELARMDVEMSQSTGGVPATALSLGMDIDVTVAEVTEDGYAFDLTYGAAEVGSDELPPELVEQLQAGMSQVQGLRGHLRTSRNGEPQGGSLEPPAGADPAVEAQLGDLSTQMQQITGAFPREAVGVGARWQAVNDLDSTGVAMRQVATYTLRSLDGDDYVMDVEVTQSAGAQVMTEGSQLESLSGSGTGTLRGSLRSLFPVEGTTSTTSELVLQVPSLGTQTQVVTAEAVVRHR